MPLTLDALTVLDAIHRRGSFAAAAEELHRVPSAVSYTMQKLEQDLDTAVFDRSGHRSVLTAAGSALLEEGRQLLDAAHALECHVKHIATGWEVELRIAVDALIPLTAIFPLVDAFYAAHAGTRLQLRREVLAGTWDALVSRRADLVIGASGDTPAGGVYTTLVLGERDMVFAVAPEHPLADAAEPLEHHDILKHRAVAVADSSRHLPPRSTGLLGGQDVFTVPDMESKIEAQCQGLGVGYVPRHWITPVVAKGRLQIKQVKPPLESAPLLAAWRDDHQGRALQWFVDKLSEPDIQTRLLRPA
ncbi:MAG: LysR family transcriptional regulator [Gammaproteobacteria bacterium]|nr:LysR family transcriptional regulator [Gammaproteobacteria bacterium]